MSYVSDTIERIESSQSGERSLIDTLQSIVVAFLLAFAFRSFVIEAFVIPTGSMAPTLRGAHLAGSGSETGYNYAVGPRDIDPVTHLAASIQGSTNGGDGPFEVPDPMLDNSLYKNNERSSRRNNNSLTGGLEFRNVHTRMGDRILVLKYLYTLFAPKRFDVVVFKNPTDPQQNFIKRLIGLPGETIWLADGDVFVSKNGKIGDFKIQRKPEHVQKRVWQPVYYSQYIPEHPERFTPRWQVPWEGGKGWEIDKRRSYRFASSEATELIYRNDVKPIDDYYAYNLSLQSRHQAREYRYSVSDIRLAAGIVADKAGLQTTIKLNCRNHEFEAVLENNNAILRMRPAGADQWVELDSGKAVMNIPGEVTQIEFWHVDQAMWLWVDRKLVAYGEYNNWDANKRLLEATGLSGDQALEIYNGSNPYTHNSRTSYLPEAPKLSWQFAGSPVTLYRVELDRDLYYQPATYSRGNPEAGRAARATHPANLPTLNNDQFFVCGDNSPASLDGRLWDPPVPWLAQEIDATPGIVARKLMLGKAFFVYFPSPESISKDGKRFVPNFGEMRFIH